MISNNMDSFIKYLKDYSGRELVLMEVCGTHTEVIVKSGLRELLSPRIRLVSGPGCPVCVTPLQYIDVLCREAMVKDTTIVSFGDMLKVPGTEASLSDLKARGFDVIYVYNPMDVIDMAQKSPGRRYVFAAVGFETTTPVFALMMDRITKEGIGNVFFLTSLKLILPALDLLCRDNNAIDGFIAPGHVSAMLGADAFRPLSEKYGKPFTVAGFSDLEVLAAVYDLVRRIEKNMGGVRNLYKTVVGNEGNIAAARLVDKYFHKGDAQWRGMGNIPDSGLYLRSEYAKYDIGSAEIAEDAPFMAGCMCGSVITGNKLPGECSLFGRVCMPSSPKGPCMVSPEGACGIWYTQSEGGV